EAPRGRGHVRRREHALVGGDGNRTVEAVEIGFPPARERLLDERDRSVDQRRQQLLEGRGRERLVGIDREPYVRAGRAHGTYARTIELGVSRELELKGPRAGIAARAFRHHLRRLGTESEGREERRERGQPRELP